MTTPVKDNYAFGIGVATTKGRKVISHGGGIEGFNAQLAYYPESKVTVVVLASGWVFHTTVKGLKPTAGGHAAAH